jgi:hypothetical protein
MKNDVCEAPRVGRLSRLIGRGAVLRAVIVGGSVTAAARPSGGGPFAGNVFVSQDLESA